MTVGTVAIMLSAVSLTVLILYWGLRTVLHRAADAVVHGTPLPWWDRILAQARKRHAIRSLQADAQFAVEIRKR